MKKIIIQLARLKKSALKTTFKTYDFFMDTDKCIRYTHHINGFNNPDYRFDKNQIAFIHIPKTGGTTLNKMMIESKDPRFANLDIHKPVSKHCSPENYKYITVLRNPIDRVWSQYQMVLRSGEGYPYKKFAHRGLDVFLEKCWVVRELSCRYLSGNVKDEPDEKTLSLAINNLSKFYAVLSFQHFPEEVAAFFKSHEIPLNSIPNERKSSYTQPTEEEVELIKKYNRMDLILFEKWKNNELT